MPRESANTGERATLRRPQSVSQSVSQSESPPRPGPTESVDGWLLSAELAAGCQRGSRARRGGEGDCSQVPGKSVSQSPPRPGPTESVDGWLLSAELAVLPARGAGQNVHRSPGSLESYHLRLDNHQALRGPLRHRGVIDRARRRTAAKTAQHVLALIRLAPPPPPPGPPPPPPPPHPPPPLPVERQQRSSPTRNW